MEPRLRRPGSAGAVGEPFARNLSERSHLHHVVEVVFEQLAKRVRIAGSLESSPERDRIKPVHATQVLRTADAVPLLERLEPSTLAELAEHDAQIDVNRRLPAR